MTTSHDLSNLEFKLFQISAADIWNDPPYSYGILALDYAIIAKLLCRISKDYL